MSRYQNRQVIQVFLPRQSSCFFMEVNQATKILNEITATGAICNCSLKTQVEKEKVGKFLDSTTFNPLSFKFLTPSPST